jgi:hypothetical protein
MWAGHPHDRLFAGIPSRLPAEAGKPEPEAPTGLRRLSPPNRALALLDWAKPRIPSKPDSRELQHPPCLLHVPACHCTLHGHVYHQNGHKLWAFSQMCYSQQDPDFRLEIATDSRI